MTESYVYGMWFSVVASIALFMFFILGFLRPRGKHEWRSMGIYSAFLVALFTEMYGFPLTIYLLTSILGSNYPVLEPFTHINGHLWVALFGGSATVWILVMVVSNVAIFGGIVIMARGWRQIYKTDGDLVASGLYRFVRHPQYLGLFLMTIGFFIQWPTIITVAMWPILMFMYYKLARREERQMERQFPDQYPHYRASVPMFFPRISPPLRKATKL